MRLVIPVPKRWKGKLIGAWAASLSALIAVGYVCYSLGQSAYVAPPALVFGSDICTDLSTLGFEFEYKGLTYLCQQDERQYLVIPLK